VFNLWHRRVSLPRSSRDLVLRRSPVDSLVLREWLHRKDATTVRFGSKIARCGIQERFEIRSLLKNLKDVRLFEKKEG
jgi:hypothetical protein